MDLILSSGYLAFARHLGVVDAVAACGVEPEAVVGTSSGALVGALLQARVEPQRMAAILSQRPLWSLGLHRAPWRGVFSTHRIADTLQQHLPERFEQLAGPLAVGVADARGCHRLLHCGPLLPALLASMAIPWLFPSVQCDGQRFVDGGVSDRVAVAAWRLWRPGRRAIVHVVERSRGRDVPFDARDCVVVRTPRTRASLWSLGDFKSHEREARATADEALAGACSLLAKPATAER